MNGLRCVQYLAASIFLNWSRPSPSGCLTPGVRERRKSSGVMKICGRETAANFVLAKLSFATTWCNETFFADCERRSSGQAHLTFTFPVLVLTKVALGLAYSIFVSRKLQYCFNCYNHLSVLVNGL